jgi:hypothetical protein
MKPQSRPVVIAPIHGVADLQIGPRTRQASEAQSIQVTSKMELLTTSVYS